VVIVQASLVAGVALLTQGGLAYLNLLVEPPSPSWGGMIAEGVSVLFWHPWLIWPPGVAMALTVIVFALLGDVVRDVTTEPWSTPAQPSRARGRRRRRASGPALVDVTTPRTKAVLSVDGLSVALSSSTHATKLVEDVSFDIHAGEVVGLMGESGCGKTMTAMSILGLLPEGCEITAGRVAFAGHDLARLSELDLRKLRGKQIGLISQDPMMSFTPVHRVGWQLAEVVRSHQGLRGAGARRRAIELLERVQLEDPELVARRFPHELSGGMAQRIALAAALAGDPSLLIADEPTTSLDVTVQAEVLELLRELQREREMAVLLITHNSGVIADFCDRVVVMYAGQVVERAAVSQIFGQPLHPYTHALLASNPHYFDASKQLPSIPGTVPEPGAWPSGCRFHPRCDYATAACREGTIPLVQPSAERETRCIHYEELVR
jgi:peptide/nickel transport system permease protein